MNRSLACGIVAALLLAWAPAWVPAAAPRIDDLVAALGGDDEQARAQARQLLARAGAEAVPKVLPLLEDDTAAVSAAAFQVLADIANEVSAPGREAERAAVTARLMELLAPGRSAALKIRGLRLLPVVVPPDADVGPVAALLDDPELREKARAALEEMGTSPARAALRAHLMGADPKFTCALLNALGRLRDQGSLGAIARLLESDHPGVRAAAARALAWTGDPTYLSTVRTVVASADPATRADAGDALLRLLDAIARKGGDNRRVAAAAYEDLLKTGRAVEKDAALAGLGRFGDGACVATVLEVLRSTEAPTRLVALSALRAMPGEDVTRALVQAYPALPAASQAALIPVLGARQHPAVLPLLEQAARSDDAATRRAAVEALGAAGLPEAATVLSRQIVDASLPVAERQHARGSLIALAGALQARGPKSAACFAYACVFRTAAPDEKEVRRQALEGIAACPDVVAYEEVKAAADDEDLREPAIPALLGVAEALAAAGQKQKALELYDRVRRQNPSAEVLRALVQSMTDAGLEVNLRGLRGTVTHWWVVGPFELGPNREGWNTAYVGEPDVNLVARYMSGKSRVAWTPVVSRDPDGKIDLRAKVANRNRCIGYAYTEITVEHATEAVLLLGVDDGERIWVNGHQVFDHVTPRALKVDQDRVPVSLEAGVNRILLKIDQETQGWEFCLRIVTPDGRPVPFTEKEE
jgi:HEAT repeat protein